MKLVDTGGAHGAMAGAIAKQYPGIRCTCFDLPSAAQGALNTFRDGGVADRCDFLGGDFLVEVPAGADAYLISGVLDNWGDGQCLKILLQLPAPGSRRGRTFGRRYCLVRQEKRTRHKS